MVKIVAVCVLLAVLLAQAALNISEGIKNGKVQTIVVPANFNALMMPR